jgi:rubrerythrin
MRDDMSAFWERYNARQKARIAAKAAARAEHERRCVVCDTPIMGRGKQKFCPGCSVDKQRQNCVGHMQKTRRPRR